MSQPLYNKTIYVYACDYDQNEPILTIAESLDEIPEDIPINEIAIYRLSSTHTIYFERRIAPPLAL